MAAAPFGSLLRTVTRQSATVFIGRGGFLVLGLAGSILLSRLLGPAGLGSFQLGLVVVHLATTFCVLGLDKGLMRYLSLLEARRAAGSRTLILQSAAMVLTLSLILSLGLFVFAPLLARYYFHSDGMTAVLRMFCVYLPVFALFRFCAGAMMAVKRSDVASNITNLFSPSVYLLLLGLVVMLGGALHASIAVRTLSQVAGLVWLAVFLARRFPRGPDDAPQAGRFTSYLRLSTPFLFVGLGYLLLGEMDIIMLGYFVEPKDVGIYTVGVRISMFVILGLEIVLPIVGPLFSQLSETGDARSTRALFGTVTKWVCHFGLVVFGLIAVLRLEILNVFGAEFRAGATVLVVLALGQLVNAATGPTGQLLAMTGKQTWEVVNTIFMVSANFVLNLLLIPSMGMTGAAIATGISIAMINVAKLLQVYYLYRVQPYTVRYIKGLVAVGLGYVACYYVRSFLVAAGWGSYGVLALAGLAFVLVVPAAIWLLGLEEEDRLAIQALRRR